MTAWSKDFDGAPRDRQILLRHPDWECPSVVQWVEFNDADTGEDASYWGFCESVLADLAGCVDDDTLHDAEWVAMPE